MKTIKLLHPFAKVMGIYFPVGKLENGGTCEFATAECLKECIAFHPDAKDPKIPYEDKLSTYHYFSENSDEIIVKNIITELIESSCRIISWFVSGDCPTDLVYKIINVMLLLQNAGIVQCGFTRNRELHSDLYFKNKSYSDIDDWEMPSDLRIVLTVENIEKARGEFKTDDVNDGYGRIIFGCPDYRNKKVNLYIRDQSYYSCYDDYYYNKPDVEIVKNRKQSSELNCKKCYENKTGCFV